ncbi:peptide/nickel transport system ATP-binding protein [Mycetocola sp. BIGb0189]|uniref:ABC transporter ATP-binding protein n=1 Tax=Mycetocola sp. BIGb0189 TaxID=2940604 RepID=UPI00216A0092|nr:ABC transporter ATP-binding protein [Mycetocola sp. BIGb0189]MCS4274863.1 peptide/nickel transport system ATP-binding protein [Mycetocola sp. BIGb0189]
MTNPPLPPQAFPGPPLLQAVGLGRSYHVPRGTAGRGERVALAPTDLVMHDGESLGIVGESGSGKSTLVRLLTALDAPSSGRVDFHGQTIVSSEGSVRKQIRGKTLNWFRKHTGVVFQDPYASLDPRMSVGRIIAEPLIGLGLPENRRARVHEVLVQVGLPAEFADRYPHQLSGGQRQRVAIARAIVHRPTLLVGDEPLSALDVTVRAQILELLVSLREELGLSLILVSHDLGVVQELCENVAVMHAGSIVEHGPTARVFAAPEHPYTARLLSSALPLPGA